MTSPPRRVLVIVTRRIGDVLLATPVFRSLKHAWPETTIDALVFSSTAGVLSANPDLKRILTVPERPKFIQHIVFIVKLLWRYDLAISLLPGDRPSLYAFFAGRRSMGVLPGSQKDRWKQRLLQQWTPFDPLNTHTVRSYLAVVRALGIAELGDVVVNWRTDDALRVNQLLGTNHAQPIAVLHPYPKFNYKMWRRKGWVEIACWLRVRGYRVVLSGGRESEECAYVADIIRDMPPDVINTAGQLSLGASMYLVSKAALYVGPDTALTHAAAALGVPTIALYGPTNAVKWGPWPRTHMPQSNPWHRLGSQRKGNVTLLQGTDTCVPCGLEGCQREVSSFSDCLQSLPVTRVIAAIEEQLQQATDKNKGNQSQAGSAHRYCQ